ncbi:ankyrin repeat domain-containing protein [Archangium minus]
MSTLKANTRVRRAVGAAVLLVLSVLAISSGMALFRPTHAEAAPAGVRRELPVTEAENILLAAAREGDTEVVRGLLAAGTPAAPRDARGYTPLILAAYHGHLETVRALISGGANPCEPDTRGNTALMGAAFRGHQAVVDLLIESGCRVDQQNLLGQTALMFSALTGRIDVSRALERNGAHREVRDAQGRTAEDWAATQGVELPAPHQGAPTGQ